MNEIDARGLSCPMPVIKTKDALEGMDKGEIVVIVDDATASENVARLAASKGYGVAVEERGGDLYLTLTKGA